MAMHMSSIFSFTSGVHIFFCILLCFSLHSVWEASLLTHSVNVRWDPPVPWDDGRGRQKEVRATLGRGTAAVLLALRGEEGAASWGRQAASGS